MKILSSDAISALASIEAADARSLQVQRYRWYAPHLVLWGIIWLLANTATDVRADLANAIGSILTPLGVATSGYLGWRDRRAAPSDARAHVTRRDQGYRWWLTFLVIAIFIVTSIAVMPPLDNRQLNTFISVFWTFLYLGIGVGAGWRLFTIGLLATTLILVGFYAIHAHYSLYMGFVSGGALIAGGLWLRRL